MGGIGNKTSGSSGSDRFHSLQPIKFSADDVQQLLSFLVEEMPEQDKKAKWQAREWKKMPGKERVYINKDGVSVCYFNMRTLEFNHIPEGWDKLRRETRNILKEVLKEGLE